MKYMKKKNDSTTLRENNRTKKTLSFLLAVILVSGGLIFDFFSGSGERAYSEEGNLYTCNVHSNYRNPATGKVEDSGGEASYATGQGMVNSAVHKKGLIEVTKDGKVYLTVKMSLMDKTSGHTFKIQKGSSGWSTTRAGITAKGRDSKGATGDVCMQIPSKDSVVRGEMFVKPMGRSVVFFINVDNVTKGNTSGMKPAVVTKESKENVEAPSGKKSVEKQDKAGATTDGSKEGNSSDKNVTKEGEGEDKAQGISLSTAQSKKDDNKKELGPLATQMLITIVAVVIGGLILLIIAAFILYLMRDRLRDIVKSYPDDEYIYEVDGDENS